MKYSVSIYSPPGYWPAACFEEVAETLRCGLRSIGREGVPGQARDIVLGANMLPPGYQGTGVLYNLEQRGSSWLESPAALDLLRRHEVWDYSASNIAWLTERGVRAKHLPIGYARELTRIPERERDLDVLFYGVLNERRQRVLDGLRERGLSVCHCFGAYGAERDDLIARSRIVLNLHYYDARIFEIVRCSYLFANRACVVSEESEDVPPELRGSVHFAPYDRLVDECVRLLASSEQRYEIAHRAHEAFKKCSEAAFLVRVVE